MNKHYKIQIPIYNSVLHFCIGNYNTYKKMCMEIEVQDCYISPEDIHSFGFFCYYANVDRSTIWLRELPTTVETYSNLVHELEHYVFTFLDSRGFKHTSESDEAYAYLFAYVYEQIDTIISKIREKR